MKIDIHQDAHVFDILNTAEWEALLKSAATDVIFLTRQWQITWWQHMTPGELLVITFRDDTNQLQAIVPLFRFTAEDGLRTLSIVGCEDISDYLDVIVAPEYERAVCTELLALLNSDSVPSWDKMVLCNLPENSTAYRILREVASQAGFAVSARQQAVCPIIHLSATWEEYLAGIDKKQRHEIRRKMRRAEAEAGARWYLASGQEQSLESAIDTFMALHRLSSPEKNIFMDSRMRGFFVEMAQVMAEQGWLHLSFIEMQGQIAASLFSFVYRDSLQVYNSGYDPNQYAQYSPGIVLVSYCIQDAIARGQSNFDFLRGEEEYKYRFGAQPTPIYELTIAHAGRSASTGSDH